MDATRTTSRTLSSSETAGDGDAGAEDDGDGDGDDEGGGVVFCSRALNEGEISQGQTSLKWFLPLFSLTRFRHGYDCWAERSLVL